MHKSTRRSICGTSSWYVEFVRALVSLIVTLLVAFSFALPARAEAATSENGSPERGLHYQLGLDLGITIGATAVWATLELLAPTLTKSCRWCDRNPDGSDALNGFDASVRHALRWNDTSTPNVLSGVFGFGIAPLAGIGIGALITSHDGRINEMPEDMLIVAESAMLALDLTDVTKIVAARERPNVHARSEAERVAKRTGQDNLSFFSGHTSLAFALATSAGTIMSMRRYRWAPLMWVAGLALAVTAGYLRIAADRHYATDVLLGMTVGSAIGVGVPYLAHRPRTKDVQLALLPLPSGSGVALSGAF